MRRQEKGFTLIELVIVLVILGILAAVAVPQFYNATTDAENAALSAGKQAVATAIAVVVARSKAAPRGDSVAAELSGSTCTGGRIKIPGGSGGSSVYVRLIDVTGGADLAGCTTNSVGGIATSAQYTV